MVSPIAHILDAGASEPEKSISSSEWYPLSSGRSAKLGAMVAVLLGCCCGLKAPNSCWTILIEPGLSFAAMRTIRLCFTSLSHRFKGLRKCTMAADSEKFVSAAREN